MTTGLPSTDVTQLLGLNPLTPLLSGDYFAVYRAGQPNPLYYGVLSDLIALVPTSPVITDFSVVSPGSGSDTNYGNGGATGTNALAIGVNAVAPSTDDVALGYNVILPGGEATGFRVVIGAAATGAYQNDIAIGSSANANSGICLGQNTVATNNGLSIGAGATSNKTNSVAIGATASATAQGGDVAIGAGSTTAAVTSTTSMTINGVVYTLQGTFVSGVVSLGVPGSERPVTSVSPAPVTSTSTGVVNGSQLYAVVQAVQAPHTGYTKTALLALSTMHQFDRAFVTDLTAIPAFGSLISSATGGSSSVCPVYYDGSAWRAG